ncbi:unnamed protein product [Notodromas monacha]|uniref:Uncharacterized protein n=1 Tax=Notodromas monacha TaxID=399045 RepID=A0A7R9G7W1_9CRUS|nr:unnamed protein product [Notodromas monacha]CAG0912486.1 unnamed protein product [Notodromas monacha]
MQAVCDGAASHYVIRLGGTTVRWAEQQVAKKRVKRNAVPKPQQDYYQSGYYSSRRCLPMDRTGDQSLNRTPLFIGVLPVFRRKISQLVASR